MKIILKQLGAWVTALKRDRFKKLELRLNIFFIGSFLLFLILFSFLIYFIFTSNIQMSDLNVFNIENIIEQTEEIHSSVDEHTENLLIALFISNFLIFALFLSISYLVVKRIIQPLKDSHQKEKELLSNLSHELKTPLAVMKAGIELILDNNQSNAEYRKFLENQKKEIDYLVSMSEDILTIEETKRKKQYKRVNLSKICTDISLQFNNYAVEKKINLETNIQSNIFIFGISNDFRRLLFNLLKNAFDYNHDNSWVKIKLVKNDKDIKLSIKDGGIGISENDQKYIFNTFYKADQSHQKNPSGSGLGLSIVKNILEKYDAKLNITSNLGKGTEFLIILNSKRVK